MEKIKLVATDLDGTFLKKDKSISGEDIRMLELLGEKKVVRVVATGRNLQKVKEVLPDSLPFDYVAFSSGAGIYDWRNKRLVYSQNMLQDTVNDLVGFLVEKDVNFHLFWPVPENFRSWYYRGKKQCHEFDRYFEFHNAVSEELPINGKIKDGACQFLVIFNNETTDFHLTKDEIESRFAEVKVVRTSSPLETDFTWMEIFHKDVSKGNAVKYLCGQENIPVEMTFGIGNDYNDLDLLHFTSYSYLVENGPEELKPLFLKAPSNENSAFSNSLRNHF